jgi:hypothetical protein
VGVQRRPEHHGVAAGTGPRNVATAAVTKADYVPDKGLVWAEPVAVWAVLGCQDDPPAGSGAN